MKKMVKFYRNVMRIDFEWKLSQKNFHASYHRLKSIDEDNTDELNSALAAGFDIKDTYRCYKCIL